MSDEVTVVAKVRAVAGKGDALAALLTQQAAAVRRAEPACLVYRVHRSQSDPDAFLFYEVYADDAAFQSHGHSAHLAAYRKRRDSEGLTAGPAHVEVYRAITD